MAAVSRRMDPEQLRTNRHVLLSRVDGTHEPAKASAKASALGDDDALGVGLPSSWSLSKFQQRVRGLLDSYLGSREMEDAVDCFREFAKETSGFVDEVVVCALRTALERPAQQREQISSLMHRLHAERVLDSSAMCRGFAKLACAWEELAVDDGPRAPCTLVEMLLSCIDAGCVGEGFLMRLPEGLLESAAAMLVSDSKTSEPGSDGDGKECQPRCEAQLRSVIEKLQAFKSAIEDARLLEPLRGAQPDKIRKEATRVTKALRKIGNPEFQHEYVKKLLVASFDWPTAEKGRRAAREILSAVFADGVLASEDVQWGLIRLLGQLDDLVLDCPGSVGLATAHLRGLVRKGLLTKAFVERCQLCRMGGAAGLSVLDAALADMDAEEPLAEGDEDKEDAAEVDDDDDCEDEDEEPACAGGDAPDDVVEAAPPTEGGNASSSPDPPTEKPAALGLLAQTVSLRPGGGGGLLSSAPISLRPGGGLGLGCGLGGAKGLARSTPSASSTAAPAPLRTGGSQGYPGRGGRDGRKGKGGGRQNEESSSWRDDAAKQQENAAKQQEKRQKRGDRRSSKEGGEKDGEIKLEVSESSWSAQQRKRKEEKAEAEQGDALSKEEIKRRLKGILNKLTIEKFDDLYKQLLDCGISTPDHVNVLIEELFEKATTQHHFIPMYTELCVHVNEWFGTNVKVGKFKHILLDQCQQSFESTLRPTGEFADQAGEPEKQLSPEEKAELEERRNKHKHKIMGNIKFVGHLLVKKMLASKVLLACAEELLTVEPLGPGTLEPLASLLTTTGAQFDTKDWSYHPALLSIYKRVADLTKDKKLPARTRFLLQDVLELREAGWVDNKLATKNLEGPKKLNDIASGSNTTAASVASPEGQSGSATDVSLFKGKNNTPSSGSRQKEKRNRRR